MDKQEILAKSQDENKNKDVADYDAQKKGSYIGFFVSGLIGLAAVIIDNHFFGRVPYEILAMICVGYAALFLYKYIKLRKKHELLVTIIWSLLTIGWVVLYVLQLCGILK
jgi:hypothetical protein